MGKLHDASELISERYGKKGSTEREQFATEALSNYFGDILRSRRKQLKLSQEELAQRIGKHRPYISRIENGEDIRISNLLLLSNALELKLELSAK
jgi:ribosome-binding protein aMBF1 (putative translation factor)